MAGAMRKMGVYLGLVEDDDRADYDARDARERYADSDSYDRDGDRDYAGDSYDRDSQDRGSDRFPDRFEAAAVTDLDRGPVRRSPIGAGGAGHSSVGSAATALALQERPISAPARGSEYRITTLHPRTYNEARTIGEHFREGVPVIMNLSEMSDGDAKRLVDFAAGLVFAVRGSIERVTNKVFLLSPPNVSVAAEDKQRIAEGGFFNQS